jgi:hypothetical protein|tara:strand:+ start:278 stop:403 length:126 start_codon:yes stop_codon:yes gene_type:complete
MPDGMGKNQLIKFSPKSQGKYLIIIKNIKVVKKRGRKNIKN